MIDHVSIPVSDLAASAELYDKLLEPLGMTRLAERPHTVGFGKKYPELWLNLRTGMAPLENSGHHVGLRCRSTDAVDAFHAAALAAGGRSDGAPGPRTAEMTTYYGAFILDPDGNKIEAMTFPPAAPPAN